MSGILTKVCKKCGIDKEFIHFMKSKRSSTGYSSHCKKCHSEISKESYYSKKQKRERLALKMLESGETKICSKCQEEKGISEFHRDIHLSNGISSDCKKCANQEMREIYRQKQIEAGLSPRRNREIGSVSKQQKRKEATEAMRLFRLKFPNKQKQAAKKFYSKPENKRKKNEYNKNRRKTDEIFNLSGKIRRRIYCAIKSAQNNPKKAGKTIELLGCSFMQLKEYLTKLLLPEMKWEDVMTKKIHIDHIIPCAVFDLSNPEEQKKCFHYTNLMPRWATTDIAKEHGSNQIGNTNKNNKIIGVDFCETLL